MRQWPANCHVPSHFWDETILNFENTQYATHLTFLSLFIVWQDHSLSLLEYTNNIFNATVDVGACEITCQFLNGLPTSATCTIQYGTNPTYENLPNTDSSTGTNVNSVTVPLSTPLQGNTLYYYVVSSMGVHVQGTFRKGMSH